MVALMGEHVEASWDAELFDKVQLYSVDGMEMSVRNQITIQ